MISEPRNLPLCPLHHCLWMVVLLLVCHVCCWYGLYLLLAQVQCTGSVPTLSIDKCDGVQAYIPAALAANSDFQVGEKQQGRGHVWGRSSSRGVKHCPAGA